MSEKHSPVVTLLSHVYKHANEAKGPSWLLLNDALRTCLHIAISSQFKFETDDFDQISNRFKFGYWGGADSDKMFAEQYYKAAVSCKNRSACIAFEKYKGRSAYILNGERLAGGSDFYITEIPVFAGMKNDALFRVFVTYIGGDGLGLSWYDNPGNHRKDKPKRRFNFTLTELKTAQKEGRAAFKVEHFSEWLQAQEAKANEEIP